MNDVTFAHNGPLQQLASLRRRAQANAPLLRRIGFAMY